MSILEITTGASPFLSEEEFYFHGLIHEKVGKPAGCAQGNMQQLPVSPGPAHPDCLGSFTVASEFSRI